MMNKLITAAINTLESLESATLEDRLAVLIQKEIMKDEDVSFIVRNFKARYGLKDINVYLSPVIEDGSMNICSWKLMIGKKALFEEKGVDSICNKLIESVVTKDDSLIEEIIRKIKGCL